MGSKLSATRAVLLERRGLVFIDDARDEPVEDNHVRAVELEWAALGYVASERLRSRLARAGLTPLSALREAVCDVLDSMLGAKFEHEPLFRTFPDGVPTDTTELWWRKVLVHYLQGVDQPCLFCRGAGTSHVLDPCLHVVCDRCFDGASYSACPVCEHKVDRTSPFFRPSRERKLSPKERVKFKLLDLGESAEDEARALFERFCDRSQAMSSQDRCDLETIVLDAGEAALSWLPERIPVKENVAIVFGTLFTVVDPAIVLPVAKRYLKTATDVLRFLAVLSGAGASLLPQVRYVKVEPSDRRWHDALAKQKAAAPPGCWSPPFHLAIEARRFRMTRLSRPLRRALLDVLEGFAEEALTEDMLRHRSYWVWAGEFLHPHEYATRFPKVARAFGVVRKFAPDGTRAPPFAGFKSRVEAASRARDARAMLATLTERPGELGRRLDHTLRVAGYDEAARAAILDAFARATPRLSTPLLLTLYRLLPSRVRRAERRVYWPKGTETTGISASDTRAPLRPVDVERAIGAITAELLRRFGDKRPLDDVLVDAALAQIMVPFNERTASRSAVALPRGSVISVPPEKTARMFLHWCQPEKGGSETDLDLSVGFYTHDWQEAGVCSYYELVLTGSDGHAIATSAGDLRNAPFPRGATELVDLDWPRALADGMRYAVMVVNNYAGMPFALLERGFAGLMLRDDVRGAHFDPRTVELKFDLQGDNGVYLPFVLDLQAGVLHWLDVYSEGKLFFNNVASSRKAITTICPTLMRYFRSGVRPTMLDLVLLHAAARSRRVCVRGDVLRLFERGETEDVTEFHARLVRGDGGREVPAPPLAGRALAALFRGDLDVPDDCERYVLFPERTASTLNASDLIS